MKRFFVWVMQSSNYQTFLRFCLIFVLVASLRHVAYAFSTLESNTGKCVVLLFFEAANCSLFWGYFQAIAIDLVIVALAYGIRARTEAGRDVIWYWVGVVAFTLVSTYANLLYGLVFSGKVPASVDWPWLSRMMVYAKPFLLSGVLPLMLIYISHITAYARREEVEQLHGGLVPYAALVRQAQARGILDTWQAQNGTTQTPRVAWLVKEFTSQIGGNLPAVEADQAIIDWRSRNGISGRRPAELEPGRNGVG